MRLSLQMGKNWCVPLIQTLVFLLLLLLHHTCAGRVLHSLGLVFDCYLTDQQQRNYKMPNQGVPLPKGIVGAKAILSEIETWQKSHPLPRVEVNDRSKLLGILQQARDDLKRLQGWRQQIENQKAEHDLKVAKEWRKVHKDHVTELDRWRYLSGRREKLEDRQNRIITTIEMLEYPEQITAPQSEPEILKATVPDVYKEWLTTICNTQVEDGAWLQQVFASTPQKFKEELVKRTQEDFCRVYTIYNSAETQKTKLKKPMAREKPLASADLEHFTKLAKDIESFVSVQDRFLTTTELLFSTNSMPPLDWKDWPY